MTQETNNTTPPPWINVDFIQKALRSGGDGNAIVRNVAVRMAVAPGDNYSSTIYRVATELDDGSHLSLLVKGPPAGAEVSAFVKESGIFPREAGMLADVIPHMESLLEETSPGQNGAFAARCRHFGSDPVEFIILEDLQPAGFKMADRKRSLGLRHSLLALRSLARFHAASHALLRRRPELADLYDNTWRKPNHNMNEFIQGAVQSAADACRTWPGFETYAGALEKLKPMIMEICAEVNDPKPGAFNVITHGDFWVNNIMFRYVDGEPVDLRMVDMQISHVASPAIDVLYFLSTSISEDVYVNYQDLLFREYFLTLEKTMELFGMQAPPRDALQTQFHAHGAIAVFGALVVRPIALTQSAPDLEASNTGDHSGIACMYSTPLIRRWLQRALREYSRKGWLT